MLSLLDTRTHASVEVSADGPIGMYVCGPTVYQRPHIGNARPFVVFSWIKRWLEANGREVTFVHNITDVNDKIYDAAPGASEKLAREVTALYLADIASFGLGLPDVMPTVTDSMDGIIELTRQLLASGHAYAVDGDVYFSVATDERYGTLSGRHAAQAQDAEPSPLKRDPRDFALWKATKPGEDTSWDTEWGTGRPGWHIECSAMALEHLGSTFEIHGGGLDLVFPHHENERAQSECAGHAFARIWAHNGMLEFSGEKMSKSLGNVQSIHDAIDEWGRSVLLLLFAGGSWHSPLEYSPTTLASAAARLDTILDLVHSVDDVDAPGAEWDRAVAALDDNFNSPVALALVHEWLAKGYRTLAGRLLDVFGLAHLAERVPVPEDINGLVAQRADARAARDFARSDALRDELAARGWSARDAGTESFVVPTYLALRAHAPI